MYIPKTCDVCPNMFYKKGYKCTSGLDLDNIDHENEKHESCPLEKRKLAKAK